MRFEILIQFVVPLTFLAIWALTTLLNRDAQPLPPRPGRPAPRPGGPAGSPERRVLPGEMPARPAPGSRVPDRPAAGRPLGGSSLPPRTRAGELGGLNQGDAIVYLETEPPSRSASSSTSSLAPALGGAAQAGRSTSTRGSQSRRSSRGRSTQTGAGGQARAELQPRRALTDQMQESMALQRAKPLEIAPLAAPIKRLTRPLTQASASAQVAQDRGAAPAASLSAADARRILATPERIREIAVLSEILRPPLALRHRR
jgi:hypothetical protein